MNPLPFTQLHLSEETARAVDAMAFEYATDIQAKSIPLIREGRDVIGRSQTGTGKTLAFGIPAIEIIDREVSNKSAPQVLILCPTRELAVQACEEIKKLARFARGIRPVAVYGGAPMDRQIAALRTANLVVGTPGRVMDHMRRGTLRLSHIKMAVLDEADEMLSMGFRDDMETILKETPQERQTVLFSATMPKAILELTRLYQTDPQLVEIECKQVTVEKIAQTYCEVPMGRKADALCLLLAYHKPARAMVFCNTKRMVEELDGLLASRSIAAAALHGDMKQSQRTKMMDAFKRGQAAILIATDVAARGIDVSDIEYVINYDIPQNTEYYVHRIGRTGRAGKDGHALTLCCGRRQVYDLMEIARAAKTDIAREELPDFDALRAQKRLMVLAEAQDLLHAAAQTPPEEAYQAMAEELCDHFDPVEAVSCLLAAHYGRLEPDIPPIRPVRQRNTRENGQRSGSEPHVKIAIDAGRAQGITPNHIVGALTEHTQLLGNQIGKIELLSDRAIVAVPAADADEVVLQIQNCKIKGRRVTASRIAEHPTRPSGRGGHTAHKRRGGGPSRRK